MKWETEEEFCEWIRDKWGDGYADRLEERVEAAVLLSGEQPVRVSLAQDLSGQPIS